MIKEITEFNGAYFVSNDGFVTNKAMKKLKPAANKRTGYCQLNLYKDKRPVMRYVHRLVAEAFVDNPTGAREVNHKDGNKLNNAADNLEWVSRSANMLHAYKNGLHTNSKRIAAYTKAGKHVRTFSSVKEAYTFCGKSYNAGISNCLTGKTKTAHGYIWKYAETDQ